MVPVTARLDQGAGPQQRIVALFAMIYVGDFIDGISMGVWKVNKPPGTALTQKVGLPVGGSSKSVDL